MRAPRERREQDEGRDDELAAATAPARGAAIRLRLGLAQRIGAASPALLEERVYPGMSSPSQ